MAKLQGKRAIVTGGGSGLGRAMVEALVAEGAEVLAIGRGEERLARLRADLGDRVQTRIGDVTNPTLAARVLAETPPDILVLNAGAKPHLAPIDEQTWESFSGPWETDVRGTFYWTQQALKLPLAPGSTVLITSSGAAIGGSPMSGGYAGAKRMQWIMADYLSRESTARKLGIRFHALIPRSIVEATELGAAAVATYIKASGLPREKFLERFGEMVTPAGFARGVIEILTTPATDAIASVVLERRVQPIGGSLSPSEFAALK